MKIGIITYHNTNNIGANLQAYALWKYLNIKYKDVEIINFFSNKFLCEEKKYSFFIKKIKWIFLFPFKINIRLKEIKTHFFQRKMKISSKKYIGDVNIENNPPKYDILISGSDQLFNGEISGNTKAYFLHFSHNSKKISYASSFGREKISQFERDMIKSELPSFYSLSSREKNGCLLIQNEINKKVKHVLDPVFLLDLCDWKKEETRKKNDRKFVFVYIMEFNDIVNRTISDIKSDVKYDFIIVYGGNNKFISKKLKNYGKVDYRCSPQDFLYYIDNSEFVITNSFHGLSMSVIFGKKIICIKHMSRNDRLQSLLEMIGKEKNQICNYKQTKYYENNFIDGAIGYKKIINEVNESKKYLNSSIE